MKTPLISAIALITSLFLPDCACDALAPIADELGDLFDDDQTIPLIPGVVDLCVPQSFERAHTPVEKTGLFSMLIASDPQYPWYRSGKSPDCNTEECVQRMGRQTNEHVIDAMNRIRLVQGGAAPGHWPDTDALGTAVGTEVAAPRAVIINGDLTAYGHPWQVEVYEALYHGDVVDRPRLDWPVYPGLGNHDYENNLGSCWYWTDPLELPWGKHGCAHRAIRHLREAVVCDTVGNVPHDTLTAFDRNSAAYSWDIGSYHFVQLNNHPSYEAPSIGVTSSLDWLERDLSRADAAGRWSVIQLHDIGEELGDDRFERLVDQHRVAAVFAGHLHSRMGQTGHIGDRQVPYFHSGAAEFEVFLLVEFGDGELRVALIDAADGTPSFHEPAEARYFRVHRFADPEAIAAP